MPAVRDLAAELDVSPATVASAYRTLKQRGLVSANRRRGTIVAAQPPLRVIGGPPLPPNMRDLASGNPDPALLPALGPALARLDGKHKLYGGPIRLPQLVDLAEADFAADVVITMGCGDACPIHPGKRYEDWELDDPAGQNLETVRRIRDEIDERVQVLVAGLLEERASAD